MLSFFGGEPAAEARGDKNADVQSVRALNGDWRSFECAKRDRFQTAECQNLRAAMQKLGLPVPEPANGSQGPKVDLGKPRVIKAPTILISEEAAASEVKCATNCGYVLTALTAAATGVGVYTNLKWAEDGTTPRQTAAVKPADAAARIGVASLGAASVGAIGVFACSSICGSGPRPKRHHAADEPFVLSGVYVHKANTEEGVHAFNDFVKTEAAK